MPQRTLQFSILDQNLQEASTVYIVDVDGTDDLVERLPEIISGSSPQAQADILQGVSEAISSGASARFFPDTSIHLALQGKVMVWVTVQGISAYPQGFNILYFPIQGKFISNQKEG